jgi:hypothetical protein
MGFSSTDDFISKITLGKKNRTTINKITNASFAGVAGRVYDFGAIAGTPNFLGYGEHLINSYAPNSLFNWTANGTGYTASAGVFAKVSGTATTLTADSQNINIISGRFYRIQYTISAWTSSNVNFTLGGATGTVRAAAGTFVEVITASSTAGFVLQASINTGVFSITNISVVEWGSASGTITPAFQAITNTNSPSMFHGGDVTPDTKHLLSAGFMTSGATGIGQLMLVDLLGCYPYIDANFLGTQTFANVNTLPRYTTGASVKAFVVSGGTGYANNATTIGAVAHNIAINYTNQSGTSGRQMPYLVAGTASSPMGQVSHSGIAANNYFPLPLANNDNGMRSVQSLNLSAASGALSYYNMVMYKELAMIPIPAANVYYERDFINMIPSLERVQDGAVLGLIYVAGAATSAATTFLGHIETAWG